MLTADSMARIDAALSPPDADSRAFIALRQTLPHLSLTRCDPSDVDADEPFRQYPRFNLYLVDGTDHCWRLTADPSRATGLVIADKRT